jgi:hypothetical protein
MRRRRLRLVTLAIGGLLATYALVAGVAHAEDGTAPAPSAQQSAIDRMRQHVIADTKALNAAKYDGKARLPEIPPTSVASKAPAEATSCAKPSSAAGKRTWMCDVPDPSRSTVVARPGVTRPGVKSLNGKVAPDTVVIPVPDFCFPKPEVDRWLDQRREACQVQNRVATLYDSETRVPLGVITYERVDYQATSPVDGLFVRQLLFFVDDATGELATGTEIAGAGGCGELSFECVQVLSNFPLQPFQKVGFSIGQAVFSTTVSARGEIATADTVFAYDIVHGDAVPSLTVADAPPTIRCDRALPDNDSTGCAYPDVSPVYQLALNGEFPELARHVNDAQSSGLPGAYPQGPRLTRLTDKAKSDSNRDRACPQFSNGGYPRPPTKSCDEYPMASTYEGASTQKPKGSARTSPWCQINEPTGVTGPTGYSVCMIDAWQNSVGGSDLNETYKKYRIIDGDKFYVQVTGDVVGPNPNPPNFPPVVNAGPDVSGFEGDPVPLQGSAIDPEGDRMDIAWTYSTGPDVDPGTQCFFGDATKPVTTIRCTDDGTITVRLSAADPYHDEPVVHLSNVSPQIRRNTFAATPAAKADPVLGIVAPKPWQLFRVGAPVTLTTNYFDPGSNDTQTCAVAWDDGSTTSSAGTGTVCSATHRYTHAGMYTIKPTITDDDGGVSDATSVMVIVYDPAAGVAQGNGWLNAPGDGGFDFTSSYPLRSATVPDGAVTFALPPSLNLNLRNHQHIEWLVVTPDGKIAIKGTAERIPGQNVGFVLYGYYGCPAGQTTGCQPGSHRLRMVVWDSTTKGPIPDGVPLLYDNRAGNSFDVDQADPQNINAGTILIQHPPIG